MIEQTLKYEFKNKDLLNQALTHKSLNPHNQNERLEFLGDAVLGLALAEILMRRFPEHDEGRLTRKRANLVNEASLAQVASELNLGEELKLGKSEIQSEGQKKPRILAGAIEALIGAVFLDSSFVQVQTITEKIFANRLLELQESDDFGADSKTKLQEIVQARQMPTPKYKVVSEEGEGSKKQFQIEVEVNGQVAGLGQGSSKKQAEQEAAKSALLRLKEIL